MKSKILRNLEKFVLVSLSVFILVGLFLNYELQKNITDNEKEILVTQEERIHLASISNNGEEKDRKKIAEMYFKYLEKLKSSEEYSGKEYDLAKMYYFIGYNAYLDGDKESATEYIGLSLDIMEGTTNYFYIVNGHNVLMNIAYVSSEYVDGINRANKIYEILQIPNIKSIDESEQKKIKVSALNGLIHISSNFGLLDMAGTYYDELLKLTEDKKYEDNIAIYAKYIYNFNMENYEEAKKFALEYIKYHEELFADDDDLINAAYIYLFEVAVALEDFKLAEDAKEKFLKAKIKEPAERFTGVAKKIDGIAYEKQGRYEEAFEMYEEALKDFEKVEEYANLILLNDKIIKLSGKISIDIEPYIKNLERYEVLHNENKIRGEIVDSLTKAFYQKNKEDKAKVERELEQKDNLETISKRINLIYSCIVIFFIYMAVKLNAEVIKRKAREVELEQIIKVDYLTKAISKECIFEKTNKYIVHNKKFTFILVDFDNFRLVNENYGHTFGDEVLIRFVEVVKEMLGDNGYIGRFGGDEFVILLNETIEPTKFVVDIQEVMFNTEYSIEWVKPTISGGAIRWDTHTADTIISEADVLLYKAKNDGKDRILLR